MMFDPTICNVESKNQTCSLNYVTKNYYFIEINTKIYFYGLFLSKMYLCALLR